MWHNDQDGAEIHVVLKREIRNFPEFTSLPSFLGNTKKQLSGSLTWTRARRVGDVPPPAPVAGWLAGTALGLSACAPFVRRPVDPVAYVGQYLGRLDALQEQGA